MWLLQLFATPQDEDASSPTQVAVLASAQLVMMHSVAARKEMALGAVQFMILKEDSMIGC